MTPPLRIAFLGTPDFAVPSLEALLENSELANVVAVYTQPDRPAGRGQKLTMPPIKSVALERELTVYQPENINAPDEKKKFAALLADVAVVVAYAQFLSPAILNIPRLGCVNVHSSLLPKYRGAAPIQYALLNGDEYTGVSTMKLVQKMDAGPILLQEKIKITPEMNGRSLHDTLAKLGAGVLIQTLSKLRDRTLDEVVQDEAKVSFAPAIKKQDGLIDWAESGHKIINKIRAFDPWPGTFGRSSRGVLKIHKARFHHEITGSPENAEPGATFIQAGGLWVRCGDGWLELLELQPQGKNKMQIASFLNGIKNIEEFSLKT